MDFLGTGRQLGELINKIFIFLMITLKIRLTLISSLVCKIVPGSWLLVPGSGFLLALAPGSCWLLVPGAGFLLAEDVPHLGR